MESPPEDDDAALAAMIAQMRKVLEARWEISLETARFHAESSADPESFMEGFRLGYWSGAQDASSVDLPDLKGEN